MPLLLQLPERSACRSPGCIPSPGGPPCPPGSGRLPAKHTAQYTASGVTATEYLADCLGWSATLSRFLERLSAWAVSGAKPAVSYPAVTARGPAIRVPRSARGSRRKAPPRPKQAPVPSAWKLWSWVPKPPRPPQAVMVFRKPVPPPPPREPFKAMRVAPPRRPQWPSLPLAATAAAAPSRPLKGSPSAPRARLPARARRARVPAAIPVSNRVLSTRSSRTARRRPIWPAVVHLRVRLRRMKRALIAGFGGRALQKA